MFEDLENGNQIGLDTSYLKDGKEFLLTFGLQKHAGEYKVFVSEIEYRPEIIVPNESHDFSIWECKTFIELEEAINYLNQFDHFDANKLKKASKKDEFFSISSFY